MAQMGFVQTDISRAPQAHRAHCLRVGSFNACPMAIGVLVLIGLLPLARRKKRLHLLSWVQREGAASRSRPGGSSGTDLTVALSKLHLDQRFAGILDGCPTRTAPALWTGHGLRFPIDVEVREVVAGLRLIPVGLEGGTNQVNPIASLRLDKIGARDISRIDEMLIWKEFLLSQIGMNRGQSPLIAEGSLSRLDMGNQLWGIFIAGLREMHFIPHPQRGPFLAIACVLVIGGVDELSRGQGRFWTPPSTLLSWLKLVLPNGAQGGDGRQRFHPVRGGRSLERIEQHPAIGSHLIGVLLALLLLAFSKRSCSKRSP